MERTLDRGTACFSSLSNTVPPPLPLFPTKHPQFQVHSWPPRRERLEIAVQPALSPAQMSTGRSPLPPQSALKPFPSPSPPWGTELPFTQPSGSYLCILKAFPLNLPMKWVKTFSQKSFPRQLFVSVFLLKNPTIVVSCVFCFSSSERWSSNKNPSFTLFAQTWWTTVN